MNVFKHYSNLSTTSILLLIFLVLSGCEKTQQHTSVRIGYLPYSSALSFFVAQERNLFKESGLTIEPVKCASSNEAMDGLRAGRLDFIVGVGLTTFFSVEGTVPGSFKCFQPCIEDSSHGVSYLLLPKGSAITDVSQLRGKKVGTYSGTSQVLVLRLLLQELGFDTKDQTDIRLGDVASSLQVDALAAGQFDAFLMLEPYASKAMIIRGAMPLESSPRVKYILDPFPAGANAVSTRFLTENPDLTKKVVASLDRAIDVIHKDEAAAKALLPKYDQTLTPEMATKTGIYRWWKQSETDIEAIQRYADLLYEGEALRNQVNVHNMFLR